MNLKGYKGLVLAYQWVTTLSSLNFYFLAKPSGAQGTIFDVAGQTQVGFMQGKHPLGLWTLLGPSSLRLKVIPQSSKRGGKMVRTNFQVCNTKTTMINTSEQDE